jgi:hypothetical protein
MSDRSPDRTQPGAGVPPPADATRDITLPPLPGRPAPAVPPAWSSYVPVADQPAGHPPAQPPAPGAPLPRFDLPTDRLAKPQDRPRSSTLAFTPPPPVQLLKVSVAPRRRRLRWVWVLLTLLPILVIAGSGIYLLVLFGVI